MSAPTRWSSTRRSPAIATRGRPRSTPGDTVPRNALKGDAIHKVDARVTKAFKINNVSLQVVAEVFNVFNHDNFGSYNAVVTSPLFGSPQQNIGNAYRPRTGQLARPREFLRRAGRHCSFGPGPGGRALRLYRAMAALRDSRATVAPPGLDARPATARGRRGRRRARATPRRSSRARRRDREETSRGRRPSTAADAIETPRLPGRSGQTARAGGHEVQQPEVHHVVSERDASEHHERMAGARRPALEGGQQQQRRTERHQQEHQRGRVLGRVEERQHGEHGGGLRRPRRRVAVAVDEAQAAGSRPCRPRPVHRSKRGAPAGVPGVDFCRPDSPRPSRRTTVARGSRRSPARPPTVMSPGWCSTCHSGPATPSWLAWIPSSRLWNSTMPRPRAPTDPGRQAHARGQSDHRPAERPQDDQEHRIAPVEREVHRQAHHRQLHDDEPQATRPEKRRRPRPGCRPEQAQAGAHAGREQEHRRADVGDPARQEDRTRSCV